MKKVIGLLSLVLIFSMISLVSAQNNEASTDPMILRTIKEIKSVNPADVANLGFGVYQVSGQYNLGSYHEGEWLGFENKKCDDLRIGEVWVEFSWDRPETDVILIDGAGVERNIYLPASTPAGNSTYGEYYWIAEDGSSYYASSNHGHGWPDLSYERALASEHLARQSLSLEQKNPDEEEPLECGVGGSDTIKLKGQLVDQMTNEPISGSELHSAYEFSPERVITDRNGNFEFIVSSNFNGAYTFLADCHGWSGNIALQKDYELWEDGQLKQSYKFALVKEKFDSKPDVKDISGKSEVDIGKVYAWPSVDISIESDLSASFNVMYQYKNSEGFNGGGNSNYRREHYSTNALPLNYEVFIQFEDESGTEYKSSTYRTPTNAECGVVNLKYFNRESKWSVLSEVEPNEDTGPIEMDIPEIIERENPEVISRLCLGCFKSNTCYPLGYRKSGEYCFEDKVFIPQLDDNAVCENNFECSTNLCIDNQCLSSGIWQKFLRWLNRLFG